jgi:hypothetical protein
METITADLRIFEEEMQKSGALGRMAALVAPKVTARKGRLRQDADDVLGLHPDYMTFKAAFAIFPRLKSSSLIQMYLDLPKDLPSIFAADLEQYCYQSHGMYTDTPLLKQTMCEGELSLPFQPYILFLITIARQINGPFQTALKELVGHRYSGDPKKAKIKGYCRMKEKQEEKYTHLEYAMPSCAVMCDIVRCLVECDGPDDLIACFHTICSAMEVVRVKNGFSEQDVPFGFRQILMNVRYTTPAGLCMICEVQLNLASYVRVKHKIHKLYSVARCTHNAAFQPDLFMQLQKQAMPF